MGIENFPGIGRRNPAFGSNQELLIDLTFQRRQLLAERRLGDMQNVSGLRQAPDVDDFDEIFQAAKIHNSGPNQYASLMTSKIGATT